MIDRKPFEGLEFVFTGQLEAMPRAEAQDAIRGLGGSVMGRVGPATDYVVVGDTPGRRRAHGQILGAQELTEHEFMQMMAEAGR